MSTQEKKKRVYKTAPAPLPEAPPLVADPPKKKRVAKVVPIAEAAAVVEPAPVDRVVEEAPKEKKKRSYKVVPPAPVAVASVPEPVSAPVQEEPKKKRAYKVKTAIAPVVESAPAPAPAHAPVVESAPAPAPVPVPVVAEEPKKKRSYKVKKDPVPVVAPAPVVAPLKKERKKRVAKAVIPAEPVEQAPVKPKAVESSEAPLLINDEDVITIKVRKFEHNGKFYFLHSAKDKLYTIGTDGQPFQYHGRYNRESETIDTDFPDSDAEY